MPFGEHLVLHRRIEAEVGGRRLRIRDTVTNQGYAPTACLVLYHVNGGWPLLAPGVHVAGTVGQVRACTPAAEGVDWTSVGEPVAGAVEWVIEHDAHPGDDGWAAMGIVNDAGPRGEPVAVVVEWDTATLPRLVQWTVAGFSNGGQCAISLAAKYPQVWGNVIDASGTTYAGIESETEVLAEVFGGDQAAYDATKPATVLAASSYPDSAAVFTVVLVTLGSNLV